MLSKWQRRQNYRHKPFWVWQEYEISKVWSGGTTTYDLIHIDFPDEIQTFDSLFEAKYAAQKRQQGDF